MQIKVVSQIKKSRCADFKNEKFYDEEYEQITAYRLINKRWKKIGCGSRSVKAIFGPLIKKGETAILETKKPK